MRISTFANDMSIPGEKQGRNKGVLRRWREAKHVEAKLRQEREATYMSPWKIAQSKLA